jgi:L-ascorbate metabolism protein UlaG (beta-lactamase superfamily)
MKNTQWYLREDVYFEPLFNHWYAWPYLIPPVTAARHVVNTHRRIMQSFVNNHQLHILASKERHLSGGEYLNVAQDQVPQIQALLQELTQKCADLIVLSDAVAQLDDLLRAHTNGESLTPLYARIPAPLRGVVELFFDLEHRASYRLIEPLLYRSEYYKPALQSLSFGLLSRVDERPFVLSTPRLPDANHVQIGLDFANASTDAILRAREVPLSTEERQAIFSKVDVTGGLSIEELFTDSCPFARHEPVQAGVRLTYTGHAGFMIETRDVAILIDPVIASRNEEHPDDVVSFSELPPKIDYVCLTHSHQDHVNLETLLQLRYKLRQVVVPKNNGGTLADPSIRLLLSRIGFKALEVDDLQEIEIPGGRIVAVPFLGEHGDLNIRSKSAWYVELLGRKFFFGADSSNLDPELYVRLGKLFGRVDVLAIGMECVGAPYTWLYGALHTRTVSKAIKNSRRLNGSNFEQAFPMVSAFDAQRVFIYALGMEPWYKYFIGLEYDDDSTQVIESNKVLQACADAGVEAETLYGRKIVHFAA